MSVFLIEVTVRYIEDACSSGFCQYELSKIFQALYKFLGRIHTYRPESLYRVNTKIILETNIFYNFKSNLSILRVLHIVSAQTSMAREFGNRTILISIRHRQEPLEAQYIFFVWGQTKNRVEW